MVNLFNFILYRIILLMCYNFFIILGKRIKYMEKKKKNNEIDMTTGSIFFKQIRFIIPLMFTGMLQLLYNAVDVIVVGRYAGTTALSAVGSTGALTNLIINVFIGLSVGISVVTATYYGRKDDENVHKTIHTGLTLALIGGVVLAIFGYLVSPILLEWMASPADIIDLSSLYMRIIFIGMPFNLIYNFSAAILRAVGDTRRPLQFLGFSGIVNVILNLIFVTQFDMSVAGVALATIISQAIAMVLVIHCLLNYEGALKLTFNKLKIHKKHAIKIIKIGIPAGIQSSCFSLSNVLIQSSVNSFGSVVMAGNAAAANIEGFVYTACNSVVQASITFVGQNRGAKQPERVRKNFYYGSSLVFIIGFTLGMCAMLFSNQLVGLYTTDVAAKAIGIKKLTMCTSIYFFFGLMDVTAGMLRGLGKSVGPMIITLLGICGFRMFWVMVVFKANPTLDVLYYSYPISWICTWFVLIVYYKVEIKKYLQSFQCE